MLTAAPLLRESLGAVRRQAWVFMPLFVARVLGGLLGLVPMVVLGARFLRSGFRSGASDATEAFWLGLLDDVDHPGPWAVASVGGVLAAAGGWLLLIVVEAGAVRLLAAQAGRRESVPDESFAEGVLRTPATWLVAGAGAALLGMTAFVSAIGAVVAGMNAFTVNPGVRTSLLMALATLLVVLVPFVVAGLEVGFARAVILEEAPGTALGEGLFLAWERATALFAPWFLLAAADIAIAFGQGLGGLFLSALPGDGGLWILRLGPQAVLWLAGIALTTAISQCRLALCATLVTDASGRMPVPPPARPTRPWPVGMPVAVPSAAVVQPPIVEAVVEPAVPDVGAPSTPERKPGQDGTEQG